MKCVFRSSMLRVFRCGKCTATAVLVSTCRSSCDVSITVTETLMCSKILAEVADTRFHENLLSVSRVFTARHIRTDDEASGCISTTFCCERIVNVII
jgi:hypothetical protein